MNLLQTAGAQPQKQPKYVPIFIDRAFTGIWTQRNVLHDPSDFATLRFYGGRPDALIDGNNVELTNRLTLQRRPGLTPFSPAIYPTPPDRAFSFGLTNGTIQVIIDTGLGTFSLSSVEEISGVAYYLFSSSNPCAANNAYAGLIFKVSGFDQLNDNGTFVCTASTSTYMILANPAAVTDTHTATAVTAGGVYYDNQISSVPQLLFGKSPGAGQTYFVAVAGVLYMGDGIDTRKYTPGNPNGTIWNWGIVSPTLQPSVTIVASGSSAVQWIASTFYSTMGLLVDSNNNIQALTSVNASGSNTTNLGKTGSGQPNWNNATGGQTTDNTVTWTCSGPLGLWQANHTYKPGDCVFVPGIGGTPIPSTAATGIRLLTYPGTIGGGIWCNVIYSGKSGAAQPKWNPTTDIGSADAFGHWNYLGAAIAWQPSTQYNSFWEWSNEVIVEPTLPNAAMLAAGTQTVFVQTANNATAGQINTSGTSGTGYTPPWATVVGDTTVDNDLIWVNLGSKTWAPSTTYIAWANGTPTFSALVDGNNNFQVCITGGQSGTTVPYNGWQASHAFASNAFIAVQGPSGNVAFKVTAGGGGNSGATEPTWNFANGTTTSDGALTWTSQGITSTPRWSQVYGGQTLDNQVSWVCAGSAANSTWTTSIQWYLPASGFTPPTPSEPYGGAEVIANSDVQAVISSGLSGGSAPSWGTIGSRTIDNKATWYTISATSSNSITWQKSHVYAFSYKSRMSNDFFATNIPPGLGSPLGSYKGAGTGGVSTASPIFTISNSNTAGAVNTISGPGSLDPQVDTIVIWRDADGGGSSNMFELTEIPNPPPVNGQAGMWSFQDFLPDTPTSVFPGLDNLIPAPINSENDPPPSAFLPMVYNFQRIWGADGSDVLFSGGPDVLTGNPNEAFNPADDFPYLAPVTSIVKNSQGLIVFLTDSVEALGGGPLTASFYSVTLAPGIGMLNYNSWDLYAGEIYFVSSDSQFKTISPSLQLSTTGFPIGDKIAALNPSTVRVAVQQAGVDNCIMVADGSTGWWRCNPHQVPGGYSGPEPIWSPFATITGGCSLVQSVEIAPGIKKLLVGPTGNCGQILKRDLTIFTDNGTAYDAWFTMGSIMLAHQSSLALLKFIAADFSGVNYQPQMSYLLDEISGPFTVMPISVFDPPSIYGTTITPSSYSPLRFYFASTGSLARCRHLQIRCDFGVTPNGDELFNLCIVGRLMVET